MKKTTFILAALLLCTTGVSATWAWEYPDNLDDSDLFVDIRSDNNAEEYCPDASSENRELYCIEVSGWDQVSLEENNEGLDNLLSIYRLTTEQGDLDNYKTDMILTLYTCYTESEDSVKECIDDEGIRLHPGVIMDSSDIVETNSEDDSSNENEDRVEEELGVIYFEEDENVLLSSDGSTSYNMYDGTVEGGFISETSKHVDRELTVKNQYTGSTRSNSDSDPELKVYPGTTDSRWSTERESGVGELRDDGGTEFLVTVVDEDDNDNKIEETFTFYPNSADQDDSSDDNEDESNEEESRSVNTKTSGDYEFSISPAPGDWYCGSSSCDIDPILEVNGDLSDKKIRLEIDGIDGWNNDPIRTRECGDVSSCSVEMDTSSIEDAPAEFEPGQYSDMTIKAEVQYEASSVRGGGWRTEENVVWNLS